MKKTVVYTGCPRETTQEPAAAPGGENNISPPFPQRPCSRVRRLTGTGFRLQFQGWISQS